MHSIVITGQVNIVTTNIIVLWQDHISTTILLEEQWGLPSQHLVPGFVEQNEAVNAFKNVSYALQSKQIRITTYTIQYTDPLRVKSRQLIIDFCQLSVYILHLNMAKLANHIIPEVNVNTMSSDSLALCVTKSSAPIILTMLNMPVVAFHK